MPKQNRDGRERDKIQLCGVTKIFGGDRLPWLESHG